MCLTINKLQHWKGKPKIAKRDILCYKVVDVEGNGLYTPFQRTHVSPSSFITGLYADKFQCKPNLSGEIDHAIHTFKDPRRALKWCYLSKIVIQAYIPKGTPYWVGKHGEYASKCIKFN